MYRFCIAESDICPKHVFEFDAADQQAFVSGIANALSRLRMIQPERHRAPAVYIFAGSGHGWVHVRNNAMRIVGVNERLIFSNPQNLWHWAYKTAWGVNHMDEQLGALINFLKLTTDEKRELRLSKLKLIQGGLDGK